MHYVRNITEDIYFVGADERRLNLFENIHPVPNGVSYNSYLLLDEQTVLFDTVDWSVCRQLLENIEYILKGRKLDYLVVTHMEPDHAASLEEVVLRYPDVKIIATKKAFSFMEQFGLSPKTECIEVSEGSTQCFGKHTIAFALAPMVHWPEVMVAFDVNDGVLFSSDACGSFGALNGKLFNDEVDFDREFIDDARRYYTNIVGKFGVQVQALLKKLDKLDVKYVCPLHGPIWRSNLEYLLDKYQKWSTYTPEEQGVLVVYASMYGNTETAAVTLASKLVQQGMVNVKVCDVSTTHLSDLIAYTFKYSHIVVASVTYNMGAYPLIHSYMHDMKALNVQNRTFAIMENGTWASAAAKEIKQSLEELKNTKILEQNIKITSSVDEQTVTSIEQLATDIIADMK